MLVGTRSLAAHLRHGAAPLALVLGLIAAPAFAQDAQNGPATPAQLDTQADTAQATQDEPIVVTGSLFRRTDTETPSPVNPLGVKGAGEAGTIASAQAVMNAVVDALAPFGIHHLQMPATAERVWRAMHPDA